MNVYDFTVKDNKGNDVERFAPSAKPETLVGSIESQLGRYHKRR